MIWTPFKKLLYSRKFLLALLGVVVLILQDAVGLDPTIVANIEALLISVIAGIAIEDSAEKLAKK